MGEWGVKERVEKRQVEVMENEDLEWWGGKRMWEEEEEEGSSGGGDRRS